VLENAESVNNNFDAGSGVRDLVRGNQSKVSRKISLVAHSGDGGSAASLLGSRP